MAVLLSVWRYQETWESKIVRAFSLREKDRMRGLENQSVSFSNPLTPTLSLRERGLSGTVVTFTPRCGGVNTIQKQHVTNRQDSRFARPQVARRVAHRDVRHESEH